MEYRKLTKAAIMSAAVATTSVAAVAPNRCECVLLQKLEIRLLPEEQHEIDLLKVVLHEIHQGDQID